MKVTNERDQEVIEALATCIVFDRLDIARGLIGETPVKILGHAIVDDPTNPLAEAHFVGMAVLLDEEFSKIVTFRDAGKTLDDFVAEFGELPEELQATEVTS